MISVKCKRIQRSRKTALDEVLCHGPSNGRVPVCFRDRTWTMINCPNDHWVAMMNLADMEEPNSILSKHDFWDTQRHEDDLGKNQLMKTGKASLNEFEERGSNFSPFQLYLNGTYWTEHRGDVSCLVSFLKVKHPFHVYALSWIYNHLSDVLSILALTPSSGNLLNLIPFQSKFSPVRYKLQQYCIGSTNSEP